MTDSQAVDEERRKATTWMEDLQRTAYANLGINPTIWNTGSQEHSETLQSITAIFGVDHDKTMSEYRSTMTEASRTVPTSFQELTWHAFITMKSLPIESRLAARDRKLPVRPLFGTIPTGRVNGFAARIPQTNYCAIILEDGLFGFVNLMSKAIVLALPFPETTSDREGGFTVSVDLDLIANRLRSVDEIRDRFIDGLGAYLVGGHPSWAKPYLPARAVLQVAGFLRDAMETFVLAHEYGHIVAGHLSRASEGRAIVANVDMEMIKTNWQQEFEADAIGLDTMLAVQMSMGLDLALSFWGSDAFFGLIDVIEKAVSVLWYGEERPLFVDTHPPTDQRRKMLRQLLAQSANTETEKSTAQNALQFASSIEFIIKQLWEMARPTFQKLHAAGRRPSAGWTSGLRLS